MSQAPLLEFADKMNEILPSVIKGFAKRQAYELYKGKITLPQFLILDLLSRQDESRMSDIARFMEVSTAAATGIVDRLVKYGYAARVFDSRDRRIIKMRLTFRGAALVKRINRQRRQMVINIFGKISSEDRRDYLRILMQIRGIFAENGKKS